MFFATLLSTPSARKISLSLSFDIHRALFNTNLNVPALLFLTRESSRQNLQTNYTSLQNSYNQLQATINSLNPSINGLNATLNDYKTSTQNELTFYTNLAIRLHSRDRHPRGNNSLPRNKKIKGKTRNRKRGRNATKSGNKDRTRNET